jgi:U3 small nucleolar ribonucleoprotein component
LSVEPKLFKTLTIILNKIYLKMEVNNEMPQQIHVGEFSPEKRRNSEDHGQAMDDISSESFVIEPDSITSEEEQSQADIDLDSYIKSKFASMELKIANSHFESLEEIEQAMFEFKYQCLNEAPSGILRSETIFSFYLRNLILASKPF